MHQLYALAYISFRMSRCPYCDTPGYGESPVIVASHHGDVETVMVSDVIYISFGNKIATVHYRGGSVWLSKSLKKLHKEYDFLMRIGKSYLVNPVKMISLVENQLTLTGTVNSLYVQPGYRDVVYRYLVGK